MLALADRHPGRRATPPPAPTRSSTRSRAPSPSSASRCRRSSPACCSSWCSASSSTGCRSSIAPTSTRPAGAGSGSNCGSRSCRSRCSALFLAASMTRYVRSSVLDVIRLDYVTTARAKGLGERVVITKHVVRNALIPVVTLVFAADARALRRRHRHRADLPHSRHRLAADQRDPVQRHARGHGGHLRLRLSRRRLQPHRRHSLWMARSSHHPTAELAAAAEDQGAAVLAVARRVAALPPPSPGAAERLHPDRRSSPPCSAARSSGRCRSTTSTSPRA